MENAVSLLAGV